MESPKAFASYSHDSPEHKEWVRHLCEQLRENGVDVILDQWDLSLGADVTLFMDGIRDSDRVLVICTDAYVEKAKAGKGGVGYERRIVTAELLRNAKTNKFIPIIRQSSNDEVTPTFLATALRIDFRNDNLFKEKLEELVREIHGTPKNPKPRLGKNPYAERPSAPEASSSQLPEIPAKVESASASETYEIAGAIIEANNSFRWRQLVKRLRPHAFQSLVQWRQEELDLQPPGSIANRFQALNKAVDIVAPLISVSLAGVESGNAQFNNQKSLLSNLLTIRGWQGDNTQPWHQTWVQIPYALGYVYHSLHGGLCLNTKQLPLALGLAREKVPFAIESSWSKTVWENAHLMGYCELLLDRKECWKNLANAYNQGTNFDELLTETAASRYVDTDVRNGEWEWLRLIFEDDFTYRASLVAYYMALSFHELAAEIAQPNRKRDIPYVPWDFLSEEYKIKKRAVDLLRNDPALPALWECLDVTQEQMRKAWESWLSTSVDSNYQPLEAFEFLATTPSEYLRFFDYWP